MALDAAEGRGVPQDWNAALDLLAHSAELGLPLAQSTLAGLAGQWPLSQGAAAGEAVNANWRALRYSIDIAAWTGASRPRVLSASPRVALVENIASPEVCDWLIARARPKLAPAGLRSGHRRPQHNGVRTNSEYPFAASERSDFAFCSRIAVAIELPVLAMERPIVPHYLAGQEFMPHHDYLDRRRPDTPRTR
jgi:hypothetical protein